MYSWNRLYRFSIGFDSKSQNTYSIITGVKITLTARTTGLECSLCKYSYHILVQNQLQCTVLDTLSYFATFKQLRKGEKMFLTLHAVVFPPLWCARASTESLNTTTQEFVASAENQAKYRVQSNSGISLLKSD